MRGRSGYCSMDIKVLIFAVVLSGSATADPGLRKVPRIYNAYVTANEKLEPSHAMPHAIPAVPVFQPIGAEPIDNTKPIPLLPEPAIGQNGELIMPTAKQGRYPQTFYPRDVGYYQQPQPLFQYPYYPQPYQYSGYQVQGNPGVGYQGIVNPGFGYQGVPYQGVGNQGVGNQGVSNQGVANQEVGYQRVSNQGVGNQGEGFQNPGYPSSEMATAAANQQPTGYKSSNSAVVEMNTGGEENDDKEYDYEDA